MKKISSLIVLITFLIPLFVFAETGTQECVKLRRDIQFEGSKCDKDTTDSTVDDICPKGDVVGAANGTCDIIYENSAASAQCAATNKGGDDSMPSASGKVCLDGSETKVDAWVTEKWGMIAVINTINTVVDWVFAFLVIIAVFYVILGAWNILTSAGDPGKVSTGRNYILYAAIGLLVGFIARAIPNLVKSIMGF